MGLDHRPPRSSIRHRRGGDNHGQAKRPNFPPNLQISISLNSLKLNLPVPVLDAELILTVHVTNPNIVTRDGFRREFLNPSLIVTVHYSSTEMSIFYTGSLLGSAHIDAGSQPPKSCRHLRLPARLSGLELAHHAAKFAADVGRREMVLDAEVDIEGAAKVLWWDHKFRFHVDSHVVVDPVFLDVVDQENKAEVEVFVG